MGDERAQARGVVLNALSGGLSLEDFHDSWPESDDPLINDVFEETEDTIEHLPGSWLGHGREDNAFGESIPYKILIVDAQLLGDEFADVSSQRLAEIRERLLKQVDLGQDPDALRTVVREFVGREFGSTQG